MVTREYRSGSNLAVAEPDRARIPAAPHRRGMILLFRLYGLTHDEIPLSVTRRLGFTSARTMVGAGDG